LLTRAFVWLLGHSLQDRVCLLISGKFQVYTSWNQCHGHSPGSAQECVYIMFFNYVAHATSWTWTCDFVFKSPLLLPWFVCHAWLCCFPTASISSPSQGSIFLDFKALEIEDVGCTFWVLVPSQPRTSKLELYSSRQFLFFSFFLFIYFFGLGFSQQLNFLGMQW
jgi:hypothetical protein